MAAVRTMAVLRRDVVDIEVAPFGTCPVCRLRPAVKWLVVEVRRADGRAERRQYRRCRECVGRSRVMRAEWGDTWSFQNDC